MDTDYPGLLKPLLKALISRQKKSHSSVLLLQPHPAGRDHTSLPKVKGQGLKTTSPQACSKDTQGKVKGFQREVKTGRPPVVRAVNSRGSVFGENALISKLFSILRTGTALEILTSGEQMRQMDKRLSLTALHFRKEATVPEKHAAK